MVLDGVNINRFLFLPKKTELTSMAKLTLYNMLWTKICLFHWHWGGCDGNFGEVQGWNEDFAWETQPALVVEELVLVAKDSYGSQLFVPSIQPGLFCPYNPHIGWLKIHSLAFEALHSSCAKMLVVIWSLFVDNMK